MPKTSTQVLIYLPSYSYCMIGKPMWPADKMTWEFCINVTTFYRFQDYGYNSYNTMILKFLNIQCLATITNILKSIITTSIYTNIIAYITSYVNGYICLRQLLYSICCWFSALTCTIITKYLSHSRSTPHHMNTVWPNFNKDMCKVD